MAPSSAGPENNPPPQRDNCAGSNLIGGHSSSTQRWNDVPRGTMDEVSSLRSLEPAVQLTVRPPNRLYRLVLGSHDGTALVPIPKRSTSPRVTSTLKRWMA